MAEKYTGIAAGKSIKASDMEAALDSKVNLTGSVTETITGQKTFSASPLVPAKSTAAANSGTAIATEAQVYAHTANTSNPHGVTKAQVGLGNVDNTSVSTAFAALSFFPAGTILTFSTAAWNATSAAFKTIWKICDGQNGTPDLVNKFLRGGSASGATGGGTVTLTENNLPQHSHANTVSNGTLAVATGGSHRHGLRGGNWGAAACDGLSTSYQIAGRNAAYPGDGYYDTAPDKTALVSSTTHGHTLSGSISITNANAGKATPDAISIVPSYYTVIYIMKVA